MLDTQHAYYQLMLLLLIIKCKQFSRRHQLIAFLRLIQNCFFFRSPLNSLLKVKPRLGVAVTRDSCQCEWSARCGNGMIEPAAAAGLNKFSERARHKNPPSVF